MLINHYTPNIEFKNFPQLDQQITRHYDRLYDTVLPFQLSPRYVFETGLRVGFRDVFYYIDRLYDHDPKTVIDVGCAECIWKKWFPHIVGFDPNTNEFSQQDFVDFFDAEFSRGHAQAYDCGMALNSLHFINWSQVEERMAEAMHIVRDRFLFTFNLRCLKQSPQINEASLIEQFYTRLQAMPYNIIVFDAPLHRGLTEHEVRNHEHLNGTVRFILEHPHG
jgi:hypothetical protein